MPNSAVMIGRPIASSEPNASSRMRTAARMPIASLAGWVWSVNIEPPSSTCSVGVFALLDDRRACASRGRPARRWPARRTGSRRRRSCRPSRRSARSPASYGVVTDTTCGCLRELRRAPARSAAFTAGDVTRRRRPSTLNTRSPVSPLRWKSCLSTSNARLRLACPAARTSSAGRRPPVCASTLTPMSTTIHADDHDAPTAVAPGGNVAKHVSNDLVR